MLPPLRQGEATATHDNLCTPSCRLHRVKLVCAFRGGIPRGSVVIAGLLTLRTRGKWGDCRRVPSCLAEKDQACQSLQDGVSFP